MINALNVPQILRHSKIKAVFDLFNRKGICTFTVRQYLISVSECVKTKYFKLMPGYSFVRLGAVAGSYQRLLRAGLFLSLPLNQNLQHMKINRQIGSFEPISNNQHFYWKEVANV